MDIVYSKIEDTATIINTLKYLEGDDVIRFCQTNSKIKRVCIQYSPDIFGMSYDEYLIKTNIPHHFPTLHHHISIDTLFSYYGSYSEIMNQLNIYPTFLGEIPMCGEDFGGYVDNNYEPIDPTLPENVKFIAGYHRPILNPNRKLTFLFFRGNDKLPTNIFTVGDLEIITPYIFIKKNKIPNLMNLIKLYNNDFLNNPKNRIVLTNYINQKLWTFLGSKYYPLRSLDEEISRVNNNTPCDDAVVQGFKRTNISRLYERIFKVDHPVLVIQFGT